MKKKLLLPFCFAIVYFLFHMNAASVDAKVPDEVLKHRQAVLTIYIYENEKVVAMGSGFIIDPKGVIVTNYHVIAPLFASSNTAIAIKLAMVSSSRLRDLYHSTNQMTLPL